MPRWAARRSIWAWALAGALLSPGAPLGLWLLLTALGELGAAEQLRVTLIYSGVATAIVFASFGAIAGRLVGKLRAAALHDGLTGLFNRRFLRESLPRLQAAGARRGRALGVLMLDLDHFKAVNDRHGHLVGDQTLVAVADSLRAHSRGSDLVARYGGEEFAVLCPDIDEAGGRDIAERLRRAIADLDAHTLGYPGPQTVSVGVALVPPGASLSPEQMLAQADAALYAAKAGGRNRSVVYRDGREVSGG